MYGVSPETKKVIRQWLVELIGPAKRLYLRKTIPGGKKTFTYQIGGWSFSGNGGSMRNRLDLECFTNVRKAGNLLRVLDGLESCLKKTTTIRKQNKRGKFVDADTADLDPTRHGTDLVLVKVKLEMITQAPEDSVDLEVDVERDEVDDESVFSSSSPITPEVSSQIMGAAVLNSMRAEERQGTPSANGRTAPSADG